MQGEATRGEVVKAPCCSHLIAVLAAMAQVNALLALSPVELAAWF